MVILKNVPMPENDGPAAILRKMQVKDCIEITLEEKDTYSTTKSRLKKEGLVFRLKRSGGIVRIWRTK